MAVHHDLACQAIDRLAVTLGLDRMATALGILSVVTANMARAIRVISVQRGYDPRDYTLVAFGGAGPLHAARLARELDISRILIPRAPGILCAMGLLQTDLRADFAVTRLRTLADEALPDMTEAFRTLAARADAWFGDEGIAPENRRTIRTVDMRYAGQNYELSVPLPNEPIGPGTLVALGEGFAAAHRRLYGFVADEEPVQLVTFRVEAMGLVPKATLKPSPLTGADAGRAIVERRPVWLADGGFTPCPIYDRDRLEAGTQFSGPAIIEQMDATTFVPDGMIAQVDAWLNLILEAA
jgi:N-methylhydantoinase A